MTKKELQEENARLRDQLKQAMRIIDQAVPLTLEKEIKINRQSDEFNQAILQYEINKPHNKKQAKDKVRQTIGLSFYKDYRKDNNKTQSRKKAAAEVQKFFKDKKLMCERWQKQHLKD